jgi:release factor glutamine methyltransferase
VATVIEYSETIPVQYQRGYADFLGMRIGVSPGVFIPRPETELLVSVAARMLAHRGLDPFILEVGTGSGNVPIGLLKLMEKCRVVSLDVSEKALKVAGENIAGFGLEKSIRLLKSDMFSEITEGYLEAFDAIVSNPPYVSENDYGKLDEWVKAEPREALWAGREGMDFIRGIAEQGARFLKKGAFLAMEVGYDQGRKTRELLSGLGYVRVKGYFDQGGYERVITGVKNG